MSLLYCWSKVFKKIRGTAMLDSTIHKTSKIESGSLVVSSSFDKHSFCGYDCEIIYCDIGSFCSIANDVKIGGGMHPISWVGTSPVFYKGRDSVTAKFSEHERPDIKRTIIGHDVWIGRSALIKQGVAIGTGAVIGMGSVVTKNVDPYTIVGGNPAKLIRKRFNDDLILELLKTKWWLLSDADLKKCAQYFKDPEEFILQHNKHNKC